MYKYETHLHTKPNSLCAKCSVRENLEFYKTLGYDGVFITNHYYGRNRMPEHIKTDREIIEYHFSDYEEGVRLSKEIGINVFCGLEFCYHGTDFLVYGLDKEWYLSNIQFMDMSITEKLEFFAQNGALIIHAHPFREGPYIDHIRLFPRLIGGVETYNASRNDLANNMAKDYAKNYGFIEFAGTDNHTASNTKFLGGMMSKEPLGSEADFISLYKNNKLSPFKSENPLFVK